MELQHVNVKLLVKGNADQEIDLNPFVPVFHTWIQDQVCEEQLLDVADYRHVPAGPGVILIGQEGDYSVDNTDSRLGVRYNRKAVLAGSNLERLKQAAQAALSACQRLEAESSLGTELHFNGQDVEIFINDRLMAPNREETRAAFQADFEAFSNKLFGAGKYSLSYGNDPRRLFTVFLKASQPIPVADLLANLA
jgi:hypothetical protein